MNVRFGLKGSKKGREREEVAGMSAWLASRNFSQ